MKRKVLKKSVERVVAGVTITSLGLVVCINDFNLAAAPIVFSLIIIAGLGMSILERYGR